MKTFYKVNAIIAAAGLVIMIIGFATCSYSVNTISLDTVSYDETIEKDKWENADTLKIDAGFADMTIERGDELKLVAKDVPEKFKAHLNSNGSIVELKSDNMTTDLRKLINKDNIGVNINFGVDGAGSYILYVPDDFENVKIDFAFGNFNIENLKADNAEIAVSFSDVELGTLEIKNNLSIETSFGDTDITTVSGDCDKFSLTSSFGDCDIENVFITESASITNSFGDLSVQFVKNEYDISSNTAFGNTSMSGNNSDGKVKVDITNSFGNTDINA